MIPARRTFGPLAGPPAKRVTVPEGDRYTVRVTLTADDGSVILLTPGRTFIELPRQDHTLPLGAA